MGSGLGGFIGWCIVVFYAATLLNYLLKMIMKKFGKKIVANPTCKKIMEVLMKIFVKNHKLIGMITVLLLLVHFFLQFTQYGLNLSGGLAASLLITQVILGMYGSYKKKRSGVWFILHRTIACLLLIAIAVHILLPKLLAIPNSSISTKSVGVASETATTVDKVFTLEELATYNGQDGQPGYVAYEGIVYDVTNVSEWKNGKHNGNTAGTDVTEAINKAPHGTSVIDSLTAVGTLAE